MKEFIEKSLAILTCVMAGVTIADLPRGTTGLAWWDLRERNRALHDFKVIQVPENEWRFATNALEQAAIAETNRVARLRDRRKKKIEEKRSRGLTRVREIYELRQAAKEGLIQ